MQKEQTSVQMCKIMQVLKESDAFRLLISGRFDCMLSSVRPLDLTHSQIMFSRKTYTHKKEGEGC